jgi:hypothetical protein
MGADRPDSKHDGRTALSAARPFAPLHIEPVYIRSVMRP